MSKVVVLAGGVGGAKMVQGFADVCSSSDLKVIGNVADDWEFHGLWVSPDIDTITYTLAELIDTDKGWGVQEETFRALFVLDKLGHDTWMQLGDQDLGLHIYRTFRRNAGDRPSEIARDIANSLGVNIDLILPTDDPLHTRINTPNGSMAFQEYFVRDKCKPVVKSISILGQEEARLTPEAMIAIENASLIVIAPSNPIVSIGPILSINGLRQAIVESSALCVAVSPLVGGRAIKGPAAQMMTSLGHRPDAVGVTELYNDIIDAIVIDYIDEGLISTIESYNCCVWVEKTIMNDRKDKKDLARAILDRAHGKGPS